MAAAGADDPEALLKAAIDKSNKKPGMFGFMSRKEQKFEDAYEMAMEAANLFKIRKMWEGAARALQFAASMQVTLGVKSEAAACYKNAHEMVKKVDIRKSIEPLRMACQMYAQLNKFSQASKLSMSLGEIQKKDLVDMEAAMQSYTEAMEYAEMDGQAETQLAKAKIEIANTAATLEKYDEAVTLFEEVGRAYAENDLLKFSCKEYYLRAALCLLASGDKEGAGIKTERYQTEAAYYRDSREAQFAGKVVAAVTNEDADEFQATLHEYNAGKPIEDWMTQILLRIKKQVAGDDLL